MTARSPARHVGPHRASASLLQETRGRAVGDHTTDEILVARAGIQAARATSRPVRMSAGAHGCRTRRALARVVGGRSAQTYCGCCPDAASHGCERAAARKRSPINFRYVLRAKPGTTLSAIASK